MATKLYNVLIGTAERFVPDKLRPLWMHPAGNYFIFLFKFQKKIKQ